MDESYLSHHGILGQKWGIRRYQNLDGTLTRAGQRRYNKAQKRVEKLGKQIADELNRDVDPNESLFKTLHYHDQTIKNLTKYKKAEEFIKSLGKTPISELEKDPYMKARYVDSPYNNFKYVVRNYELEMPDGTIKRGTHISRR